MDFAKHAVPAGATGQVHERLGDSTQGSGYAAIRIILGCGLDRPINQNRAAHDGVPIDESPIAAVQAAIAVIAQYKIMVARNDKFAVFYMVKNLVGPLAPGGDFDKVAIGRREIVAKGIFIRRVVDHVRLVESFSVYVDIAVDDADAVAGQADYPFDVVGMIFKRKFKDDDVAAANSTIRENFFVPGPATAKNKFVYEHVIADQQGRLHRWRGDFESLNNKGCAKEGEQHGDQQQFGKLGEGAAAAEHVRMLNGRGDRRGDDFGNFRWPRCGCFDFHEFL